MPADWDAPRRFGLPIGIPGPGPMGRGVGMVGLGINMAAAITTSSAASWMGCTFGQSCSCFTECGCYYNHKFQLPAGWDAPLMNPVPVVPTCTTTANKKGGEEEEGYWAHCITFQGGQADPVLNGLHRGTYCTEGKNC